MIKYLKLFFTIQLLLSTSNAISQKEDSLELLNEKTLTNSFYANEKNPEIAFKYASAYLRKAKKQNDPIKILNGFYFLAEISNSKNKIKYGDSIILYSQKKDIHNTFYPFFGYLLKADEYFEQRNFKKSINNYLYAKKNIYGKEKEVSLNYRIGLLKSRLGHYDEALSIFKDVNEFYSNQNSNSKNSEPHLMGLFALSDGYLRAGKVDSSSIINVKGFNISKKVINNSFYKTYFIFNQGLVAYKLEEYNASIDSLNKTIDFLKNQNDYPNLSEAYFYLAKSNLKLGNNDEGLKYLIKIDSIFMDLNDLHPDLRETYEILIKHYSNEKDNVYQLKYLNRLLSVDSIISNNYKYLSTKIYKEYDVPRILKEKNDLILNLKTSGNYSNLIISILIVIVIIFIVYLKKNHRYKKNYKLLSEKSNIKTKIIEEGNNSKDINIPESVIESIENGLQLFEENNQFLDSEITLNRLSKQINSNSSYVSKVINHSKGQNFSNYVNSLRINYSIQKLKENSKFRRYKIRVIAEECGFKSAETYSKKFYGLYGIYPSYFIKKLKEEKQKQS
ncbi:helix-turn-helix domain-containing protein [Galbibacter sp. BG1]|uniref:helix-turn-helix domain-containing protein n=1 Tax=Galbibacter sp. BG1 TaxID=1170699 RepID=UPI0015C15300|nr:helix-turn-helix domain-containing protein [Galbibacter sp. BG1]QLE00949.1 helix-turn-helix domain-containing protein [Galbibacter sp. BG1]